MTISSNHDKPSIVNGAVQDPSLQRSESLTQGRDIGQATPAAPASFSFTPKPIACPKCGAGKVAKSRAVSGDRLIMRLLPKRPFRCLHCYHRFWHAEPFNEDPRRLRTWAYLLAAALLVLIWLFFPSTDPVSTEEVSVRGSFAEEMSIADANPGTQRDSQRGAQVEPAARAQTSPQQLIESSGFQPPRTARAEVEELLRAGVAQGEVATTLTSAQWQVRAEQIIDTAADPPVSRVSTASPDPAASLDPTDSLEPTVTAPVEGSTEDITQENTRALKERLEQWRLAWQAGDVERYLEYYAPSFQPENGMSRAVWESQRRTRVTPEKKIELQLSDIQAQTAAEQGMATVSFVQAYQSENYQESARKELRFKQIADQWYIVGEQQIP